MIGSSKLVLLLHLFLLFFARCICLSYSSSDESDESDEEESEKLGYESGSAGTFGTRLGGLSHGLVFPLGFTLSYDESCGSDGGSLALP